jgi:hypothetical protein
MSECAPEYTRREKMALLVKHLAWAAPLFAVTKFWFLPWFKAYAQNAHCQDYGYFTGMHVVFYFVFVFLPIGSALAIFAIEGRRCIKVIQVGQNPLPNEKVLRKTKYKYGSRAKIQPYAVLLILLFMLGLGIRGIFWANEIIYDPNNKQVVCSDS